MTRPTMHRLAAPLLCLAFLLVLLPAEVASAQDTGVATLRLGYQTPWSSSTDPLLDLRVVATNAGAVPLGGLSVGVAVYTRVTTRIAYEQSLAVDPSPAIVIHAETRALDGEIAPNQSRVFEISLPLDFPGIDPEQSGIYPMKVDLRSNDVSLAALRTPAIYLVRKPELPMRMAWTFVLDQPIGFGPDDVFTSTALEDSLRQGGRLAGQIRALQTIVREAVHPAVDLVVSPTLLTQLGRMRSGYAVLDEGQRRTVKAGADGSALAATALVDLKEIAAAPGVELSALPFADPQLPALLAGGLSRDFDVLLDHGAQVVSGFLGRDPNPAILRPPEGAIDEETLAALAARGVRVVALDPGAVVRAPNPLDFALAPVVDVGPAERPIQAVLPDQAVATLLGQAFVAEDPVRGAQAALGELAAIWQEQPGRLRGIAVTFSDATTLPGGFFSAFARDAVRAPWLLKLPLSELGTEIPPVSSTPSHLALAPTLRFSPTYVDELKQARRRVAIFRSMIVGDSDAPERMETSLLLAESGVFLTNPSAGLSFIRAVRDEVEATLDAVQPDTVREVTLTARTGAHIPIRVTNGGDQPLRVIVRLVSQHLESSPSDTIVLDAGVTQTLTFDVDLKTNGRFPVQVQIASPSGRVIDQATMIVRSTAYNRIALVITMAAALVLLALWARRFLPRRTS